LAIGFLFLGGGTHTFSTQNSAIAALLISLYPRLPTGPNDNRCHLQVIPLLPCLPELSPSLYIIALFVANKFKSVCHWK
jgi:hypothetical protein